MYKEGGDPQFETHDQTMPWPDLTFEEKKIRLVLRLTKIVDQLDESDIDTLANVIEKFAAKQKEEP